MGMYCELGVDELASYTAAQLNNFFPDKKSVTGVELKAFSQIALERTEHCFKHIVWPSYSDEKGAKFNYLNSDQYCAYLYLLSNVMYKKEDVALASKVFYLNKTLHAFNCMYDTQLPDIFWLVHVVGTVLGKAHYSDYLVVRQNCTIGALRGEYPIIGEKLILSAGASIIGGCHIGHNVMVGPNCTIFKQDVPDNSLITSVNQYNIRPNSERPIQASFRFL